MTWLVKGGFVEGEGLLRTFDMETYSRIPTHGLSWKNVLETYHTTLTTGL
jgi:hypothetical protein